MPWILLCDALVVPLAVSAIIKAAILEGHNHLKLMHVSSKSDYQVHIALFNLSHHKKQTSALKPSICVLGKKESFFWLVILSFEMSEFCKTTLSKISFNMSFFCMLVPQIIFIFVGDSHESIHQSFMLYQFCCLNLLNLNR